MTTLSSIEVTNRDSLYRVSNKESVERAKNPRLTATYAVIGNFRCPEHVEGSSPDRAMIHQARELLGYKTNITLVEWWALFPSRRWWSYAITATKYLARKANYKFFLRCLVTAATQGAKFKMFSGLLKQVTGKIEENLLASEKPDPVVCPSKYCGSHTDGLGSCEMCWPLRQKHSEDLQAWYAQKMGGNAYNAYLPD